MTKRALLIGGAIILVDLPATYFAYAATLGVSSSKMTIYKSDASIAVPSPSPTLNGSCTLAATQDTYIDEFTPRVAYGTSGLAVRSEKNKNKRSLVMFDPAACALPSGATVKTAVLSLFVHAPPIGARSYELRRATSTWSESTTWQRQPTFAAAATGTVSVGLTAGSIQWTVTSDVVSMRATPAANFGWGFGDTVEGATVGVESGMRSREASANAPVLTITYGP